MAPKNTRRQNRCCRFDVTTWKKRGRFTENLNIYLSSPAPNSLLQNPSNFGATASHWLLYFLLFFFFLIFNRMDAWSLMRGDAFIHFVSGSRRVNIRLGVLLLIPKSPLIHWELSKRLEFEHADKWYMYGLVGWVWRVQTGICSRKWDTWSSWGLWNTNRSPNPGQKTIPSIN